MFGRFGVGSGTLPEHSDDHDPSLTVSHSWDAMTLAAAPPRWREP